MADINQAPSTAEQHLEVSDADLLKRWTTPANQEEPVVEDAIKVVEQPKAEEEEATEEKPETEATKEPEKEAEADEEKPKPVLVTKFQVFDERGELEIPTNLKFSFKANGKEYEDVPIDKLVNLAQMGTYNHDRELKYKDVDSKLTSMQDELAAYKEAMTKYEEYTERLLADDDYLEVARQEYSKIKSPENQARIAREQLQQEREKLRQEKEDQTLYSFTTGVVGPAMERLLKDHPTVSQYELMGRFNELMAPLMVRGRVPVDRLDYVRHAVETDLANWVKGVHTEREQTELKRKKEVESTKKELVNSKRQIARAIAPSGIPGSDKPQLTKPKSADSWYQDRFFDSPKD